MRREFGATFGYSAILKAKESILHDSVAEQTLQFAQIPEYFRRLAAQDPGATANIQLVAGTFNRCFVAPSAARNAFRFCRPFVALDGTFLKTRFVQTLLLAATMDGANQLVLLAWGIVPSESQENWTWFLERFLEAFPHSNDDQTVMISDRDRGLKNAIASVLPLAVSAFCCYHLRCNIATRFGVRMVDPFWSCVYAASAVDFERAMEHVRSLSTSCADYLAEIRPESWAAYAFPGRRYTHVTSNLAESANAMLLPLRERSIVALLSGIWNHQMQKFFHRALEASRSTASLTAPAYSKFSANVDAGRRLDVIPSFPSSGMVTDRYTGRQFLVQLPVNGATGSCSCNEYFQTEIPCPHMCALALVMEVLPASLVSPAYSIEWMRRCYSVPFPPILTNDLETSECLPPRVRRPRGRPSERRIRSRIERNTRQ